jgi:hypothetical protein
MRASEVAALAEVDLQDLRFNAAQVKAIGLEAFRKAIHEEEKGSPEGSAQPS